MNLKQPETLTQLRSSFGVMKPLTDAMSSRKTKVHFPLGESAKVVFEKLKKLACTAHVLVPPKFGEPFCYIQTRVCMPSAVVWCKRMHLVIIMQ